MIGFFLFLEFVVIRILSATDFHWRRQKARGFSVPEPAKAWIPPKFVLLEIATFFSLLFPCISRAFTKHRNAENRNKKNIIISNPFHRIVWIPHRTTPWTFQSTDNCLRFKRMKTFYSWFCYMKEKHINLDLAFYLFCDARSSLRNP